MMPLACQPGAIPVDLKAAHAVARQALTAAVLAVDELADGYRIHLPVALLAEAARWIEGERRCCPFLQFELLLSPGADALTLTLRGEGEAKAVLMREGFA